MRISTPTRGIAVLYAAIISVFLAPLCSAEPFKVFSVGDPVMDDLRNLSREAGDALLSLTPPLSSDELRNALSCIDYGNLSTAGTQAYDRILAALREAQGLRDGAFRVKAEPSVAVELSGRTNPDIDWTEPSGRHPAAVMLPLDFSFSDAVHASGDLQISRDPSYYASDDSYFSSNLPTSSAEPDLNMPLRSFLATGGPWWSFQIGRNRLSFGAGITGNLAVSDNPDYYDHARLSLFSPNFKYSLLVVQLPLSTGGLGSSYAETYGSDALTETTNRYLYYHRWDIRLFERVSIGIGEGCLVGNSPLELRFLNPLSMYHGFFAWNDYSSSAGELVGSMLSLDLDWAIAPGWAAYGQIVMNDYQTEYEKEKWPDDAHPNGLGYLAGLERTSSAGDWRVVFTLEAAYADPYLYLLSSPFASYVWMRRLSALSSKEPRYAWIGHAEGRDFVLFHIRARFARGFGRSGKVLALSAAASYKLQGEHGLEWDWASGSEAASEIAPTGTPERRLKLSGTVDFACSPRVALGVGCAAVFLRDADHIEGKTETGAEMSLSASYTFK